MSEASEKMAEFQAMCEEGSAEGCHGLAEYLQLIVGDADRALALFKSNCDPDEPGRRRYGPSCFAAASILTRQGRSTKSAVPEYFEKACAANMSEGCSNLALIYRHGWFGADKSASKAAEYYERACEGGDGKSCFGAATVMMESGADDKAAVLERFERACLLGYPYGCSNAVVMLTKGDGNVAPDAARAARLRKVGEELSESLGLRIV